MLDWLFVTVVYVELREGFSELFVIHLVDILVVLQCLPVCTLFHGFLCLDLLIMALFSLLSSLVCVGAFIS